MKTPEQMISDYYISPAANGMLNVRPARKLTPDEVAGIKAAKPVILAIFAAREAAKKARQEAIANIPGLEILRSAIDASHGYHSAMMAAMEDEQNDGVRMPARPAANIPALAAQYPAAALWLRAEDFLCASHHAKFGAGKKAQDLILAGDLAAAKDALDNWASGLAID